MAGEAIVVGLLAPPGLPATLAQELAEQRLPRLLAERVDARITWDVRCHSEARAHDAKDDDELIDVARESKKREGWDIAVSLTDLPLDVDRRPVVADAFAGPEVAIVSLPALGPVRRRHHAGEVTAGRLPGGEARPARRQARRRQAAGHLLRVATRGDRS